MKSLVNLLFVNLAFITLGCSKSDEISVVSPDGVIKVMMSLNETKAPEYSVYFADSLVIVPSALGIEAEKINFSNQLTIDSVSGVKEINEHYELLHGKTKSVDYIANSQIIYLSNSDGNTMNIEFRVSDDGVAFRYGITTGTDSVLKVTKELTRFEFNQGTHTWIQPKAKSRTGWSQVNPSYEEHYENDILVSNIPDSVYGWVFPALFRSGNKWVVLSETFPDGQYCATHLEHEKSSNGLTIGFPEITEGFPGGEVLPAGILPLYSNWHLIAISNGLGTIAESTLGTDLMPASVGDFSYVKPGRAAWSWALLKDPSVNYETSKEFILYAADMGWEYCLIDASWDTQIGWDKIIDLQKLAASKNVGLILWYNSAGDWNTTPYTPKHLLLTPEGREVEFNRLEQAGIKGVKVDFFCGDGQSMANYYVDILKAAHKHHLMVNCHGATLPRGLQRTYPNLVSMEAIRGFEYATFDQGTADRVPEKSTTIPFTRNVFDPMDFTPVCFNEYDNNKRVTANGAELAQAVIFLSGIQHYAETAKGMDKVPDYVKKAMKDIPVNWDETKFVDGYPGKYVVIARRKGDNWFVAGINSENKPLSLKLDLPFLVGINKELITDGNNNRSFQQQFLPRENSGKFEITLIPYGGFLLKSE